MPSSRAFKKQTVVTHSSSEAEIISLDAGLRMEGIPAMSLWYTYLRTRYYSSCKLHEHPRRQRGKNANVDNHAEPPPEYQAGVKMYDARSIKLRATGSGWSVKLLVDQLLQKSFHVKRTFIFIRILDGEKDIRKFNDLAKKSSRRARRSTKFTIKY